MTDPASALLKRRLEDARVHRHQIATIDITSRKSYNRIRFVGGEL
jgi:hypothetical protein